MIDRLTFWVDDRRHVIGRLYFVLAWCFFALSLLWSWAMLATFPFALSSYVLMSPLGRTEA